jgi:hypothetical protein
VGRDVALGILFVAFVAAESIELVETGPVDAAGVIAIIGRALVVAVVLLLVRAQLFGIGRVLTLLAQPTHDAGYARLLSVPEANGCIDAELARSRRRDEPLTALALTGSWGSAHVFPASYRGLGLDSMPYLQDFYVRARLAGLLSQLARRSDFVIRAPDGSCFVVCPGTAVRGALAFAHRATIAGKAELGIELHFGIASFPADGESLADLTAVASERAREFASVMPEDRRTTVEHGREPAPNVAQALTQ